MVEIGKFPFFLFEHEILFRLHSDHMNRRFQTDFFKVIFSNFASFFRYQKKLKETEKNTQLFSLVNVGVDYYRYLLCCFHSFTNLFLLAELEMEGQHSFSHCFTMHVFRCCRIVDSVAPSCSYMGR